MNRRVSAILAVGLLLGGSLTGCAVEYPEDSANVVVHPCGSVVLVVNEEGTDWSVERTDRDDLEIEPGDPYPLIVRENGVSTFVVPLHAPTGSYVVTLGGTKDFLYRIEVE